MTLPEMGSFIKIDDASTTSNLLSIRFDFRTFDKDRLLVWNPLTNGGNFFLHVGQTGFVEYELKPNAAAYTIRGIAKSGMCCEIVGMC